MIVQRFVPALALLLMPGCNSQQPAPTDPAASGEATEIASPQASEDAASAASLVSRYTSLKNCKLDEEGNGEDWSVSRCPGLGGFSLVLNYGDARDDLALRQTGRKDAEIGLPYLAGGGFNALGETIEWRGSESGGGFEPTGLIVRNNAVQDPEHPEKPTSLLVVIDLSQGCAVAQLKPGTGQNERARAVADGPRQPCLRN
ncbi:MULTISPECIES: hypothetical protein [unclassified Novosphingobium]|uniref:hypothetical protein n=1 Tax=unclassified Novosphingobium TaxID=2644732 RepID=UPI000ED99DB7|nr:MULTISPECIES: hypothetical protein [unclassified Novosphingobium]HCF24942.1 hypothetical protein [Novosphingobium sp.]HQV03150.1 hypothetical protein [Novosphingobium sp.]